MVHLTRAGAGPRGQCRLAACPGVPPPRGHCRLAVCSGDRVLRSRISIRSRILGSNHFAFRPRPLLLRIWSGFGLSALLRRVATWCAMRQPTTSSPRTRHLPHYPTSPADRVLRQQLLRLSPPRLPMHSRSGSPNAIFCKLAGTNMAHLPSGGGGGCGDILTPVSRSVAIQYPMAAVQSLVVGELARRSSRHRPTQIGVLEDAVGIRYVSITY
jgi:hypothetical protein